MGLIYLFKSYHPFHQSNQTRKKTYTRLSNRKVLDQVLESVQPPLTKLSNATVLHTRKMPLHGPASQVTTGHEFSMRRSPLRISNRNRGNSSTLPEKKKEKNWVLVYSDQIPPCTLQHIPKINTNQVRNYC